jgi:hypothetical protein
MTTPVAGGQGCVRGLGEGKDRPGGLVFYGMPNNEEALVAAGTRIKPPDLQQEPLTSP